MSAECRSNCHGTRYGILRWVAGYNYMCAVLEHYTCRNATQCHLINAGAVANFTPRDCYNCTTGSWTRRWNNNKWSGISQTDEDKQSKRNSSSQMPSACVPVHVQPCTVGGNDWNSSSARCSDMLRHGQSQMIPRGRVGTRA